jgi:hypothetical protein
MRRYRLYVDESGDHTYSFANDPDRRYLGLTGIAIEQEYYRTKFQPELESLKQVHFPHSPDDPVVLVRRRIIAKQGPFGRLSDPAKNVAWGKAILEFIRQAQCVLFTVVIDKQDHLAQYGNAAYAPFSYCMLVLIGRLRGFLHTHGGQADVMVESRGAKEDRGLQQAYDDQYRRVTRCMSGAEFQRVLTSKYIKFRRKEHNIAGLQLADLIATPSKVAILAANHRPLVAPPSRFSLRVEQEIRRKYNQYGRVFLP